MAIVALACSVANPIATQAMPPSAWGGFAVSESVPYQPILQSEVWIGPQLSSPMANSPSCNSQMFCEESVFVTPQSTKPAVGRAGLFQKFDLSATWLPQFDDSSLGWTNLSTHVVFGFPFLRRDTPLLVTPAYKASFIDRPATPDLPSRLHEANVEFRHLRKFGNGPWAMDIGVTLGLYADDHNFGSSDAFRVSGRGIAVYETSPATKWVLGVLYLNRLGTSVVPVVGVIYEPTPYLKMNLVFPSPKIAKRIGGFYGPSTMENWVYLAGEFGSGVWAITRPATNTPDLVTTTDLRLVAGYERKITGGMSSRVELAYVFAREIEFRSATPNYKPDDTLMLRAGITY